MLKKMGFLGICGALLLSANPGWGMEGAYLGLGIGPETALFRQKSRITQSTNFNVINKTHLYGKRIFGSIFAGYGTCACNNFFLAGELNFDFSSAKFRSSNDELVHMNFNNATYAMRQNFGVSILPGIVVNHCTLFYARLGYSLRQVRIRTTEITLPNKSKNCSGIRYGLGVKQHLAENFAIRLEYSESIYEKMKIVGTDPASGVLKTTSIKPRAHKFELGVVFNFL